MTSSPPAAPARIRAAGLDASERPDGAVTAIDPQYRVDPQRTCAMYAEVLARLHGLQRGADPASPGPEHVPALTLASVVGIAEEAVSAGHLGPIDPAYAHMEPPRLLDILGRGADELGEPGEEDLVLTHGRPELPRLWCDRGATLGFADWSAVAVADRHRDLAVAAASVAGALGPMLVPELFEDYGRRPDPRRLDWWALADQLVGGRTADPPR